MNLLRLFFCLLMTTVSLSSFSQKSSKIDSLRIFTDDKPLDISIATNLKLLLNERQTNKYQNALVTLKLPDSTEASEQILIRTRGKFRLNNCAMPSLSLNFRTPTSPKLSFLKELKLVNTCKNGVDYEQVLIKEYLVYKIFNLLTDMSFRVRLLRIKYEDIQGRGKPSTKYAILLENVDVMAARNNCREINFDKEKIRNLNRTHTTLVDVFQYMIGNTDWSMFMNHNIKLIRSRKDSLSLPYPVPYDFDFGGLVNAEYAVPAETLPIQTVRDRLYRGFPRTMEELQEIFDIYNKQKEKIYALINNCEFLLSSNKKDMIRYLDDFYRTINNKKEVQKVFIDNARII